MPSLLRRSINRDTGSGFVKISANWSAGDLFFLLLLPNVVIMNVDHFGALLLVLMSRQLNCHLVVAENLDWRLAPSWNEIRENAANSDCI